MILLFATGFGPTAPPSPIGEILSQPAPLAAPVTIRIGGVTANVAFAVLVGAGLYQFNVTVPDVPDGDQSIVAEIGGVPSQANALLSIQR